MRSRVCFLPGISITLPRTSINNVQDLYHEEHEVHEVNDWIPFSLFLTFFVLFAAFVVNDLNRLTKGKVTSWIVDTF